MPHIRINTCSCEEDGILETLGRVFGVDNVSVVRRPTEAVLELRGVSKDAAISAVAEHRDGDSVTMDAIAYNGYVEGDEGYPGVVADAPLGACTVYIVTASGPRPEKAPGERFFLDEREAQAEAERLSRENAPGIYSVHEMEMAPPREETAYVYGIDEDAAFDTTVVQDGLIFNALTALGDDLMSDEIEAIDPETLQEMADEAGVSCGLLALVRAVKLGFLEQFQPVEGTGQLGEARPTRKLMTLFLEHGLAGVRAAMLEDWELYNASLRRQLPPGEHYVRDIMCRGLQDYAASFGVGIVCDVARGKADCGVEVAVYWVGGELVATYGDKAVVQRAKPKKFDELAEIAGLGEAVGHGKMFVEAAPPEYHNTTLGRRAWHSALRFVLTGESNPRELDDFLGREADEDENDEYGELWQRAEEIIRQELKE